MKSLISFIGFIKLAACLSIWGKDSRLDPGRIMWPKETWVSSPIQLSQTNAGSNAVLTFTFRVSTALAGVLEIDLPSGFSGGPLYSSGIFTPNQDNSITTSSLTLPSSAGVYGPFVLITRSSSTGQIIDANYVFGCVAISSSVSSSSTLIVTNEAFFPIVGSSDTLYFAFTLSQNLWKYDIIEIVPSTGFILFSTITCQSVTVTGVSNILYGPKGDNSLPCAIASQSSSTTGPQTVPSALNSAYIYGLSQDVYVSGSTLSVKLSVSLISYPTYKKPASSNTWKVNIWRWGTTNLIAQYTASSGPTTPVEGRIMATWDTINSAYSGSDIVAGMTIFTKVTFTTQHDIPEGGSATIVFSNVDISGDWWSDLDGSSSSGSQCYLTTPISGASCVVSSATQVSITFTNKQSAGSVSIALISTLYTNSKISSITTTTSSSYNIDDGSNLWNWPFSGFNLAFTWFKFHAYTAASYASYPKIGGGFPSWTAGNLYGADSSIDLYWSFKPNVWTTSTVMQMTLPVSSTLSYTQNYIDSFATKYELDSDLGVSDTTVMNTPPTKSTIAIGSNSVSVVIETIPINAYYVIALGNSKAALPYVASNLGTFYECYATSISNYIKEVGVSIYSVLLKDYAGAYIYTTPFCTSKNAGGIPLVSVFAAKLMNIDFSSSTNNFALEITVLGGNDLATGLTKGSTLPSSSTVSGVTAIFEQVSGNTIIKLTGLGTLATSSDAVRTFLAMGKLTASTFDITTKVYYTTSVDSSLRNYLYQSTSPTVTFIVSTVNELTGSTPSSYFTVGGSGSFFLTEATLATQVSSNYVGVGLPTGFQISSGTITVGIPAINTFQVSNTDDSKNFGFIIGYSTSANWRIPTFSASLSVTGLTAPGFSGSSSLVNTVYFNIFGTSSFGVACDISGTAHSTATVVLGSIFATCSLSSMKAAGPNSVDTTMTIEITTTNNIGKNGSIVLITSPAWTYYSTTGDQITLNYSEPSGLFQSIFYEC